MQLGMIGCGRMGASMVRRLLRAGHECVVYDANPDARMALAREGAVDADSLEAFAARLSRPRVAWLMVPAALVDRVLADLVPFLTPDDVVVDGGNSRYLDDIRRSAELSPRGIHYIDVGTSGGVWGLERGYCLMIGGEKEPVRLLDPILSSLAPGAAAAPPTPGRVNVGGTADRGYLHCGPSGAGHFVKMVHNGIEYGLMAAYSEGLNVLYHAGVGKRYLEPSAEISPLAHPEYYQYDMNLADIAEVWRRGSVISSWLLDLAADALLESPELKEYSGEVADSGEGRWTIAAALDEAVPTPVLSAALFERFSSRGEACFADRLLSAMRHEFGGHLEREAHGRVVAEEKTA